ncbi:Translation initiation factor 1A [Verticillium nonalfalfae]|uniref:Eukaryotic translation initiation factor 1A n=1 Tax=Verticillium nonalfalfae TaxID=1051616 RepID=A0A3M9YC25_9PEZI|nr:Translation initiation factor 1A [Verticillium nonalfalfae]RNJ56630.1 Translation initiation factor 1A [Verticillium nonalfalfae]
MPKNKGKVRCFACFVCLMPPRETSSRRAVSPPCSLPKRGGGKNRRRGKNESDHEKRELTFKEDGQEYAQVVKMLGNGRLEALCFDGTKRLGNIRGKLRKKVWINQGDIILLSLREYQDDKGDVILKYTADEARSLKAYGELPESAKINETDTYGAEGNDDCNFEFDDDRDDSDDDSDDTEDGNKGKKDIAIDDI